MSLVVLFVFGLLAASLSTGAAAPQSTVEAGSTISTAGTYELAANASNTTASKGLTVTGSPVEIDGRGGRLAGPGTRNSIGISAPDDSNASSLVVRNLTVTGWRTGIRVSNVSNVTIRDTVVRSNHTGVRVDGANTVRIENSTVVVDDGTVFEDVNRLVLENTSIRTTDSESIDAINTTVYVGRHVRLTGGLRVRRGVVKLTNTTATPTATSESGDAPADTETPTTTAPPKGVTSIHSGSGGSGGGGDGGGGGASSAGSVPQDGTTTPTVRPTDPANETVEASNTTTPTLANEPESTPDPTETTGNRKWQDQDGATSRKSSPTAPPDSTVVATQADGGSESTVMQTPGFGVVVAVSALVVWSIRRVQSD